jgi:hypothetical protein
VTRSDRDRAPVKYCVPPVSVVYSTTVDFRLLIREKAKIQCLASWLSMCKAEV